MDDKSTAAKRLNAATRQQQLKGFGHARSRSPVRLKQQQQQHGIDISTSSGTNLLPLHLPHHQHQPPPRSGQQKPLLLPQNVLKQFKVRDKTDASGKRRLFQVNIPRKMILMLTLTFLLVPMLIFFYKEVHIHDHDHEHFKPEKFINVDTEDVLSHLLDGKKNNSSSTSTTINQEISSAAAAAPNNNKNQDQDQQQPLLETVDNNNNNNNEAEILEKPNPNNMNTTRGGTGAATANSEASLEAQHMRRLIS